MEKTDIPTPLSTFDTRHSTIDTRMTLAALALVAVGWQVASFLTPPYVVPGWEVIAVRVAALVVEHPDWIGLTVLRVLGALALSFAGGGVLAVLMYRRPRLESLINPLIRIVMAVPVICWILFAVLWFKGTEMRIVLVLVLVCGPIFLIELLDGMKAVPRDWLEMVRALRPTQSQLLVKLMIPASLPIVLTSWKVNLSLAIRVVTIAELVGATSGIGYALTVAQSQLSIADIFAWTLVLVAILLLFQQTVSWLEKNALRWREI